MTLSLCTGNDRFVIKFYHLFMVCVVVIRRYGNWVLAFDCKVGIL